VRKYRGVVSRGRGEVFYRFHRRSTMVNGETNYTENDEEGGMEKYSDVLGSAIHFIDNPSDRDEETDGMEKHGEDNRR
jgi:hypothetical protein